MVARRFLVLMWVAFVACPLEAQNTKTKSKPKKSSSDSPVLVRINEFEITERDLDRALLSRGIPERSKEKAKKILIEELIDAHLIRDFLNTKKIEPDPVELDRQVSLVKQFIEENQKEELLKKLGYDDHVMREELGLPIAWAQYCMTVIADQQIQEHFDAHRVELDGSKVRSLRIFLKVPPKSEESKYLAAEKKLSEIRQQILDEKISFEDAARKYSESPSADKGGDIGEFAYIGRMPESFTKVAFSLKEGEISEPFRTQFGVDIIQIAERIPGDLSLEDVRSEIIGRLSRDLWTKTTKSLRSKAKITRPDDA